MNTQNKKPYLAKRANSFKYAINGIIHALKTQPNAQIHLFAAIMVTVLGFYFKLSNAEWILIILAISFVISAELFNSAIEYLVDLLSPEQNISAGKIKDMAAGAVLIGAISAAIIGFLIFFPKIKDLL